MAEELLEKGKESSLSTETGATQLFKDYKQNSMPVPGARTSYALFYPFNRNHDSTELLHQKACKNFN